MKRFSLLILYLFAAMLAGCAESEATAVIPSTSLANYQVVNSEGKAIARLEDVLIAADNGQISYAIIVLQRDAFSYSKAAFVETAVPRTAVPWNYFSLDSASEQLQFKVDSSVLYAAPLLRDKPNQLEADWDANILAYWQPYAIPDEQK